MRRRNKVLFITTLSIGLALLSGCTQLDQDIDAESTGIWNKWFVYPMSLLIKYFAKLFTSGDNTDEKDVAFGLAIVVVTIIIRLILVPLNVKQLKSSKAMQDIQPELKEIQAKYSSKDQNTQQKLQKETMELFQKHGVNPLAGCLPIFIQMPVMIAMYHAIMRTPGIKDADFLWFQLGSPDYILPLIAGGATFLQQKLMMSGGPAAQNPQMKVMLYIMPIFITVIAFFFPSALALYWVVGNVFMVAQTIFIRKPMMKEPDTGGDKK